LIHAASAQGDVGVFDTVWGIFDFNNEYNGAFVRGSVIEQEGTGTEQKSTGVINSANGAVEFFVYEQGSRKKQKLRI
ncbi:MAG: hypothetical protein MJK04_25880, partial [Psychrosphaera sp.]|nr:hypothetical protein [Psychrosphaera sp.]